MIHPEPNPQNDDAARAERAETPPAVTEVRPPLRLAETDPSLIELRNDLLSRLVARCPRVDLDRVKKAYEVARDAHEGQKRSSGEPYITHTVWTCINLIDLLETHLDTAAACSALLHDTVEDTELTLEDLRQEFGNEVAYLVDGVTKISEYTFDSAEAEQAENFRKMLLSMAKDLRVIFIKLADRLHNMRTIQYLREEKAKRIGKESLDIYAPLAHRLGIARIKRELEDLSLKVLDEDGYRDLSGQVAQRRGERERFVGSLIDVLRQPLVRQGIEADIQARPKHFYSIYQKMKTRGVAFEHIYDLYGLRIVVDTKGGVLPDPRCRARSVDPGAGSLQGLHRDAQEQSLPITTHDGRGARR